MCVPSLFSCLFSLLRELGDPKEEAGRVGGGFGWQLVGVLISRSNQKVIVKEAWGNKSRIQRVGIRCLLSQSSRSQSKASGFSGDSRQHVY